MILVVYKKKDKIESHLINHTFYKVGECTSMGWTVLSIQILYRGKFYKEDNYHKLFLQKYYESLKKIDRKRKLIKILDKIFS